MANEPLYYTNKQGEKIDIFSVIEDRDFFIKDRVKLITLRGLQKLGDHEQIVEKRIDTPVTPTGDNNQQHVVNLWLGYAGNDDPDQWVRGSGEASKLNTGKIAKNNKGEFQYFERSEIDSQYRYAMAEKRAYARAMTKILKLFGIYCEVEAQAFTKDDEEKVPFSSY
jgi:hypothetical protein